MKNKKFHFGLLTLLVIPVFLFVACNQKDEINSPVKEDFNSSNYAVVDITDVLNGIEDASLNKDFTFNPTLFNYSFMNAGSDFRPGLKDMIGNIWFDRFDFGKHLGLILRRLNLSDDQKIAVKALMTTYHTNMKPLVQQFREANKDIVIDANAKRKAIVDDFKNGIITREEASAKLKELNQATHDKIANNPVTIEIKAKMCTERNNLLDGIASILNADQLTKWNDFVAKFPNPCK